MNKKIWEYESFQEFKEENKHIFKNHIAVFQKLEIKNDCIITFENPKCREGAMKFIYVDGVITVRGDYGTASFNWHNPNNHILAYGQFDSFGYILSKLEAIPKEGTREFDSDLFTIEFKEFISYKSEEGYINNTFDTKVPHVEKQCDVVQYMNDNYDNLGGDLEAEDYDLGMYTTERPYLWWYGLQTALNILEKEGSFDS